MHHKVFTLASVLLLGLGVTLRADQIIYVTDFSAELGPPGLAQFGTLNLTTGVFNFIGMTSAGEIATGVGGELFGTDEDGNLVKVDRSTGNTTLIGPTGLAVNEFVSDLNGKLYVDDFDRKLWLIDPTTGAPTLVGSTGLSSLFNEGVVGSMGGGTTATFYATYALYSDATLTTLVTPTNLYGVDSTNAATSLIGPTGQDLYTCLLYINGILYGFSSDQFLGAPNSRIFSVDTGTGASTFITDIDANLFGIEGVALVVPEPATFALGGGGLLIMGLYRRRRA